MSSLTMARPDNAEPERNDALDDLFAYDKSWDDVFENNDRSDDAPAKHSSSDNRNGRNARPLSGGAVGGGALGIDEEVVITKKRAPVAKLDESRYVPSPIGVRSGHCQQLIPSLDYYRKGESQSCGLAQRRI
jgi:hypothetical protein